MGVLSSNELQLPGYMTGTISRRTLKRSLSLLYRPQLQSVISMTLSALRVKRMTVLIVALPHSTYIELVIPGTRDSPPKWEINHNQAVWVDDILQQATRWKEGVETAQW